MKNMEWEERVWRALKDAVSGMPPFVRGRALKKIIAVSEERAERRDSDIVGEGDLLYAVDEVVPGPIKSICVDALKNSGLDVDD